MYTALLLVACGSYAKHYDSAVQESIVYDTSSNGVFLEYGYCRRARCLCFMAVQALRVCFAPEAFSKSWRFLQDIAGFCVLLLAHIPYGTPKCCALSLSRVQ